MTFSENDFRTFKTLSEVKEGQISWKAPSNIALVKYWGKSNPQLPKNPSISFTLNNCCTETKVIFKKVEKTTGFQFSIFFEGEEKPSFRPKIETFFERIEPYVPFLKEYRFEIHSSNSFPHSSGIASSASGMSALSLCIMSLEKQLNSTISEEYFTKKASFLARLGSGSACRSVEGGLIAWGKHPFIEGSSDLYGVSLPFEVNEIFHDYQDTILLIDKGEKQVSSTVGHQLMYGHPFAEQRFRQANQHIEELSKALINGDVKEFIRIVETEALTLHSMMMTSNPYFILMKPNTLEVIHQIWDFREQTDIPICFTLDAGANVHILYPKNQKEKVLTFIKNNLVQYCQNGHYILDNVGQGSSII